MTTTQLFSLISRLTMSRVVAGGLVVIAAACGGGNGGSGGGPGITQPPSAPAAPVRTTSVSMRGSSFVPPAILVDRGATVQFTNEDGIDHDVTFANQTVGSTGRYRSGSATLVMPSTVGTFSYRCTLHGGMDGTVTVQ